MRIWFCIGLVLVFTDLVNSKPVTKILNLVNEHNDEGYHFKYRISDGQERDETAKLVTLDGKTFYRVTGQYRYLSDSGQVNTIKYTADENGYRASSVLQKIEGTARINSALLGSLAGGGLG